MPIWTLYRDSTPIEQALTNDVAPPDARAWVDTTGQNIALPAAVPAAVYLWQLQSWLHAQPSAVNPGATMLDDASAVAAAVGPPISLWWSALSTPIDRKSPNLPAFAARIGLTTSDSIDAAFIAAARITV